MAMTVKDVVNDVITQLSMVGSYSTQYYAAPHIQQHVQDAIILMMDDCWWPHLTKYFKATLDGTTGKITSDLVVAGYNNHAVSRYEDIEFVMVTQTEHRLRRLPTNINPYNLADYSGNAIYMEPDPSTPARPFTVWPLEATDSLVIRAKLYPTLPISADDTVYLDRLMLTYAAAWMYATDDGTNPGQIDKFEKLLEKRLMQVKRGFEHQQVPLTPRTRGLGPLAPPSLDGNSSSTGNQWDTAQWDQAQWG